MIIIIFYENYNRTLWEKECSTTTDIRINLHDNRLVNYKI